MLLYGQVPLHCVAMVYLVVDSEVIAVQNGIRAILATWNIKKPGEIFVENSITGKLSTPVVQLASLILLKDKKYRKTQYE